MQELAGRVAVITGAGSGLGAAMADALGAEGMRIAALDIDGDAAQATPEFAIRHFVRDLRDGRDYIVTHGGYHQDVEAGQRAIMEAFDRAEES